MLISVELKDCWAARLQSPPSVYQEIKPTPPFAIHATQDKLTTPAQPVNQGLYTVDQAVQSDRMLAGNH